MMNPFKGVSRKVAYYRATMGLSVIYAIFGAVAMVLVFRGMTVPTWLLLALAVQAGPILYCAIQSMRKGV